MVPIFWRLFSKRKLSSRRKSSPPNAASRWRARPALLQLEDRVLPATTLLVTTPNDLYVSPQAPTPPASLSLRGALEELHAVNDTSVLIKLPINTYNIQLPATGTSDILGNLLGGEFVIAPPAGVSSVVIEGGFDSSGNSVAGATPAQTVINAQGLDRVFAIVPAQLGSLTVTFVNLTIEDGAPASTPGTFNFAGGPVANSNNGGGICFNDPGASPNQNSLVLNDVVVTGNKAAQSGGNGGGVWTQNASVTVTNGSAVLNNQAANDGGGIGTASGNISIVSSSVTGNTAGEFGGGVSFAGRGSTAGVVSISGTTAAPGVVSGNTSASAGGGIYADNATGSLSLGNAIVNSNLSGITGSGGGGVWTTAPQVAIDSSQLDFNQAKGNGGALDLSSPSFASPGGNELSITGSDLSGNHAGGDGGAVANANVLSVFVGPNAAGTNSTFNNNVAGGSNGGGAIYDDAATTLQISGATFNNNDAVNGNGGALDAARASVATTLTNDVFTGNDAGQDGGAVYVPAGTNFQMSAGRVANNVATSSGGGVDANSAIVTIQSTTFSGNAANSGAGGGLNNSATKNLDVTGSTFSGNESGTGGGGINSSASSAVLNGDTLGGNAQTGGTGNRAAGSGGGTSFSGSNLSVNNSLILGNTSATDGGGLQVASGNVLGPPNPHGPFQPAGSAFPTIGYDAGPSIIFDITPTGLTVINTGQPAYDGIEDTYVAVVDEATSGVVVTSLSLTGSFIFGFDGDGTQTYGVPASYTQPPAAVAANVPVTGYEGPGTYFTNIDQNTFSSGNVNFDDGTGNGLQPGEQTYFSLEEGPSSILNGGPPVLNTAPIVSVTSTVVAGNTATGSGGGINVATGISLQVAGSTVMSNATSGTGGGLNTAAQANTITGSDFLVNSAASGGGAVAFTATPGASAPDLTVQQSSIVANQAGGAGSGGGILAAADPSITSTAPTPTVNLINTTVGANSAGISGGGLANLAGDDASILYSTFAYNQAPTGGGVASTSTGTANTNLGDTIVTQNFNFAPPPPLYPSSSSVIDPTPPFPAASPDLSGTFADLTEGDLNTTLGLTAATTPAASTAPGTVIGHNIIGAGDGSTGITNQSIVLGQFTGDLAGTTSAPILAVGAIAANGVPSPAPPVTLVAPNLPLSNLPQLLAPPLAIAQQTGFADAFIFTVAPADQRGSPLLNTATNANVVYLRPISNPNTVPLSNNPDVGAMEVTTYVSGLPLTEY